MNRIRNLWRQARKLVEFNLAVYRSHKERVAHDHGRIDWDQFPKRLFAEHSPIFVISTGRCGTTLLTRVFEEFPSVLVYQAQQPELIEICRGAHAEGLDNFEAYKLVVSAARFELVAEAELRGRRYVETNNRTTFFAPHLAELFPKARFVHLIRHPGDFVRSAIRRGYYEGHFLDMGRITPIRGEAAQLWPSMNQFERCSWLWNETNQYIESFKAGRGKGRVLTIFAEDLFSQTRTTAEILEFLELPSLSESLISKWIRDPVNAQTGGRQLNRFQSWDAARIRDVERWAPLAAEYGYALSTTHPLHAA